MRNKQLAFIDGKESAIILKKHSSLIQIANITSLNQRKIVNGLMRIARQALTVEPEQRVFGTELGRLRDLCWIGELNNQHFKATLKALQSLQIEYNVLEKDKEVRGCFSFLSAVSMKKVKQGQVCNIEFEFPSVILEAVKRPSMYSKLDLFVIRGLESKYSIALYELLKDYQNLWGLTVQIDDFRKLMGVSDGKYKIFTALKTNVVDIAIKEINEKTDIQVGYELKHKGRKFTDIVFRVKVKQETIPHLENKPELSEKLRFYWLREAQISEAITKRPSAYILENLKVVEAEVKKGKIKQVSAYLWKALQTDFRPKESPLEQQKKQEKEVKKIEQHQQEKEKETQKMAQIEAERQKFTQIETRLKNQPNEKINQLETEFRDKTKNNLFLNKFLKEKGLQFPLVKAHRLNFVAEKVEIK